MREEEIFSTQAFVFSLIQDLSSCSSQALRKIFEPFVENKYGELGC
jgi:hypothetical protein